MLPRIRVEREVQTKIALLNLRNHSLEEVATMWWHHCISKCPQEDKQREAENLQVEGSTIKRKTILKAVATTLDKDHKAESQWSSRQSSPMVLLKVVMRRDTDRDLDLRLVELVDLHRDRNSKKTTGMTRDQLTIRSNGNSLHRLVTNAGMINVNNEEPSLQHTTPKINSINSRDSLNNRCRDTRCSMMGMSTRPKKMMVTMMNVSSSSSTGNRIEVVEAEDTEEETRQEVHTKVEPNTSQPRMVSTWNWMATCKTSLTLCQEKSMVVNKVKPELVLGKGFLTKRNTTWNKIERRDMIIKIIIEERDNKILQITKGLGIFLYIL